MWFIACQCGVCESKRKMQKEAINRCTCQESKFFRNSSNSASMSANLPTRLLNQTFIYQEQQRSDQN
jgi:hypothetical protein